jgi:hypothetical protein
MKYKVCQKCTHAFWIVVAIAILLQIFTVKRSNPPVTGTIEAPEQVMAILHRSCFDCHSNKTKWPWYSYVAPMSWLVTDDVHVGRKHMNFSEWDTYNDKQKRHKMKKCGEMVEEGEMPLWFYLPLHPEGELLPKDIEILTAWSKSSQ